MYSRLIELDCTILKAMSSRTRGRIIKELELGKRTISDLSKILAINKSAIEKHLLVLIKSDLITKMEDEKRVWTYYSITSKGMDIIKPEKNVTYRFIIGITSFTGFVITAIRSYQLYFHETPTGTSGEDGSVLAPLPYEPFLFISSLLFIIALYLLTKYLPYIIFKFLNRKYKVQC